MFDTHEWTLYTSFKDVDVNFRGSNILWRQMKVSVYFITFKKVWQFLSWLNSFWLLFDSWQCIFMMDTSSSTMHFYLISQDSRELSAKFGLIQTLHSFLEFIAINESLIWKFPNLFCNLSKPMVASLSRYKVCANEMMPILSIRSGHCSIQICTLTHGVPKSWWGCIFTCLTLTMGNSVWFLHS